MISEEIVSSYYEFLGVNVDGFNEGHRIFKSKNRDILVNETISQEIILTRFQDELILSVSPEIYEDYYDSFFSNGIIDAVKSNNRAKCVLLMTEFATNNFLGYNHRIMERFVRSEKIDVDGLIDSRDDIELLVDDHYDNYWKTVAIENVERLSKREFDVIWKNKKKLIDTCSQYIALEEDIVVSYCKVSNVIENMANLVVYTSEFKRNHGYGKKVVSKMVNACLERSMIPTYWVSVDNYHSKALVKSLAFTSLAKEDVISFD